MSAWQSITYVMVITLVLYFVPAGIAFARKHQHAGAILALNIFLGWTVVGWIVCLVWAFMNQAQHTVVVIREQAPPARAPIDAEPTFRVDDVRLIEPRAEDRRRG